MNLVDTVRNTFVPIHRAGYPFIAGFAAVTLLLGYFSSTLFWIGCRTWSSSVAARSSQKKFSRR